MQCCSTVCSAVQLCAVLYNCVQCCIIVLQCCTTVCAVVQLCVVLYYCVQCCTPMLQCCTTCSYLVYLYGVWCRLFAMQLKLSRPQVLQHTYPSFSQMFIRAASDLFGQRHQMALPTTKRPCTPCLKDAPMVNAPSVY